MHTHYLLTTPYPTLRVDVEDLGKVAPEDRRTPGVEYLLTEELPTYDIEKTSAQLRNMHAEWQGRQ